ncbi:MAG TPA: glycosyltransferase family 2 protein [Bauldia sp.]|nr:glycosyltransferase family 2 protein [Bauldia sp.]
MSLRRLRGGRHPGTGRHGGRKARPAVSVIVSTYNWSSALRCALRSVQLQTLKEIEVLIVGDGCTDDSEEVVLSFKDPRFQWHNLPRNFGSQYAPNNHGLQLARAKWVAYLGQDDVWHPRHLEACLQAANAQNADFIASLAIMYGPPGSGWRAMSGLLVDGVYSYEDFMPPSSWMHRKAIARKIGYWKRPDETPLPVDCTFLRDAVEAGARIGCTDEVTVFKFNAAWRRDAYRVKPTGEQEAILAKIEAGGEFRDRELVDVMKAVAADRYLPVRMPSLPGSGEMSYFRRARVHKGVEDRFSTADLQIADQVRRFRVQELAPFEWHEEEVHPVHGPFRWTGPSPIASTSLPILFDRDLSLRVQIAAVIEEATFQALRLRVQGVDLPFEIRPAPEGAWILHCVCPKPQTVPNALEITFQVGRTRRPVDFGPNKDRRWLGIAIGWIEVGPA